MVEVNKRKDCFMFPLNKTTQHIPPSETIKQRSKQSSKQRNKQEANRHKLTKEINKATAKQIGTKTHRLYSKSKGCVFQLSVQVCLFQLSVQAGTCMSIDDNRANIYVTQTN